VAAQAQSARLYITNNDRAEIALGDTLYFGIYVDAGDLALTSASFFLSYDEQAFALVAARVFANGDELPFADGPFLSATVYANSAEGAQDNGLAGQQLDYVAVSGVGAEGVRQTGSGQGLLASLRLRVVAYPPQGKASVRLDAAGSRQPSYTIAEQPGIEQRFRVEPRELHFAVEPEGLLPLPDVIITRGQKRVVELSAFYLSQIWQSEEITWGAAVLSPAHVQVQVEGMQLILQGIDEGESAVQYWAQTPDGRRSSGVLMAQVEAEPRNVFARALESYEDSGLLRYDLAEFLLQPEVVGTWSVGRGAYVEAVIEKGELLLVAPANWWGDDSLSLRFCPVGASCETVELPLSFAARNDAPEIVAAEALDLVVGQRREWTLDALVGDVDDDLEELIVALATDGGDIVAWYRAGDVLVVEALSPGESELELRVEDLQGASAVASWRVRVREASSGPQFLPLPPLELVIGQEQVVDLSAYVRDADTPIEDLSWQIDARGLEVSWRNGTPPVLIVRAAMVGQAVLNVQVRDGDGNAAVAAWDIEVSPAQEGTDSSPVQASPDLPAPEGTGSSPDLPAPEGTGSSPVAASPDLPAQEEAGSLPVEQPPVKEGIDPAQEVNGSADIAVDDLPPAGDLGAADGPLVAAEEPSLDVVDIALPALQLRDIPDVVIASGATHYLDLGRYAEAGLSWSYVGGGAVQIELVEDVVLLRAPEDWTGRVVVIFSATDVQGRLAAAAVRIDIIAGRVDESTVAAGGDGSAVPPVENAPDLLPLDRLQVATWPDYSLVVGMRDSALVLDALVLAGDAEAVEWSVRGGAFIVASIDAERRLLLDGRRARVGREVFYLTAWLGDESREVVLGVQVREPDVASQAPAESTAGDLVDLDPGPSVGSEGETVGAEVVEPSAPAAPDQSDPPSPPEGEGLSAVAGEQDRVAPQLQLSGALVEDGWVAWRLESDEVLQGVVFMVDGMPVSVEENEGYYAARWLVGETERDGGYQLRVFASDVAGNVAQLELTAMAGWVGGGFVLHSSDGRLRVLGGAIPVPALLYAEGDAYRIDFMRGQSIELVLRSELASPGLFYARERERAWQELEASVSSEGGLLRAVVAEPGWFRADSGVRATAASTAPIAYPNPFNASAAIRFTMPGDGLLRAVIYSALGQRVRVLAEGWKPSGAGTLFWRGRNDAGQPVASGAYFVEIDAAGERQRVRLMLLR